MGTIIGCGIRLQWSFCKRCAASNGFDPALALIDFDYGKTLRTLGPVAPIGLENSEGNVGFVRS